MSASPQPQENRELTAAGIETPRLLLRAFQPSDVDDIFEYASDLEVTKHVRFVTHKSTDDTRAFLKLMEENRRAGSSVVWAVTLRSNGKVIGSVGFVCWTPAHRRAELGYALNRHYWNQGYASEAVAALVAHGFSALDLNRIEAFVSPAHRPSQRVLEKCNFQPEGLLRQHEFIKGRWHDSRVYSILRQEFEKRADGH